MKFPSHNYSETTEYLASIQAIHIHKSLIAQKTHKATHTVILPDWTFKKWGLSNFVFQSF